MENATIEVPAEQADAFRRELIQELGDQAEQVSQVATQVAREGTPDTDLRLDAARFASLVALLNEVGWGADATRFDLTAPPEVLRRILSTAITDTGSEIHRLCELDPPPRAEIRQVLDRARWLVDLEETLSPHPVA
jgi:hypothetical protein